MKHYFTNKLFLVLFALLGVSTYASGQNMKSVKTWNFLSWSEATLQNLAADVANWTPTNNTTTQELERYSNKTTLSTSATPKANGVTIAELDGMLFPALIANNFTIRCGTTDNGVQFGKENQEITIKDLKAEQQVTIVLKSANSTDPRGISAITNMTGAVGSETYKPGTDGENTYLFTVTADGNVKFKYNKGIILKSITVSEEASISKVVYVYDSSYAGYTLADDPLHTALIGVAGYEVTDLDIKELDGSTVDNLLDYDLVFSSEAVGGTHKFGLALKSIVNKVPMLNLKSFYYNSGRWGWATGQNPAKGIHTMMILESYRNHEIFKGVTIGNDGTCVIFTASDASNNQVQAYKDPLPIIADDVVMAKDGTNTYNTIHEHGTTNKYMLIPFASNLIKGLDSNAITLILNASNYLIATKEAYVAPSLPVATPVIAVATKDKKKAVTITCATAGASIYYTTDGSTPTVESTLYTEPFDVWKPCTVTTIAVKEGMLNSEIALKVIENENYVARHKTLLWANFKDQPQDWGSTGDIVASGKTGEKELAGFKVGSKGQRVNLQNTGVSEIIGASYGPATADDAGASAYAMSFLAGTASAYIQTTTPVQAPFDVTLWWCMAKGASYTEKLTVSVKTVEAEEWTELGTLSNNSYKSIKKQSISYEGTDAVLVKVASASANGSNNNSMIFDLRLLTEGEDPVATPVITTTKSILSETAQIVTIETATPDATIYYTTDGTEPTTTATAYAEPLEVTTTCTVKAMAVKAGLPNSAVASLDISIEGSSVTATHASKIVLSRTYFTVSGIRIAIPLKGINLVKTVYEDGTIEISKVVVE